MAAIPVEVHNLKKNLDTSQNPQRVTPRELLRWFSAERRSAWTNRHIRIALNEVGLYTNPDFETANLDEQISIFQGAHNSTPDHIPVLSSGAGSTKVLEASQIGSSVRAETTSTNNDEPTLRVRILPSAIRAPDVVAPTSSIEEATTTMLSKDFSQLPVVRNKTVVGVISWKSLGTCLALGSKPKTVADCLEEPLELRSETSLLDAIEQIVRRDYALIKDDRGALSGIVTTADLSAEFRSLSEPFLLLREVENYVRQLIVERFSLDEIRSFKNPSNKKEINGVADLSFGEYVYGLQGEANWKKLRINLDRKQFIERLDHARKVRNDVMHFDPDPIEALRISDLREFVRLLRSLAKYSASADREI